MGKINAIIIAVILAGLLLHPAMAAQFGELAPAFILPGQTGQEVRLADFKDKVVYLDFWASWCSPCRQSFPWMTAMQDKYGAQGLQVIAINLDAKVEDARKFILEHPARFLIALDTRADMAVAYKVTGMPTSLLIMPGGKVILRHVGFRNEDKASIESGIRQALAHR